MAGDADALTFSRWELTCCRTRQETNVGMTMWLSQLLFFQIQSCCPPPPVPPVLSFSRMHLLAAAWGESNGGGARVMGAREKESKGWFSWWWTVGTIVVPRWAFMLRLKGRDSAEYTEGRRGSTLTFLFTQSTALWAGADQDQHSKDASVRRESEWMKNGCALHHAVYIFLVLIITLISLKKSHVQLQPLPNWEGM